MELQLGKCLHEIQLWGIFSISDQVGRAPCGWYHHWAGILGFNKRAGWASQGEQASKEHLFMASASPPASNPAWVPVLTSFCDEQQCRSVRWINPFLPNLLLGQDVCAGIETLTKTNVIVSDNICLEVVRTLVSSSRLWFKLWLVRFIRKDSGHLHSIQSISL